MAYIVGKRETPEHTAGTSQNALLPPHQAGDLIVVWATQASPTAQPAVVGGDWGRLCVIHSWNVLGHVVAWRIAASSSEVGPAFVSDGISRLWFLSATVIRDAHPTAPFGAVPTLGTDYRVTDHGSSSQFTSGALATAEDGCLVFYSHAVPSAHNQAMRPINAYRGLFLRSSATGGAPMHTVGFIQQDSAGSVPSCITYSQLTSSGSLSAVIAVRNAPAGSRQPDIRTNFQVLRWYGSHGALRDPATVWQSPSTFAASIGTNNGGAINCATNTPGISTGSANQEPESGWGATTALQGGFSAAAQESVAGAGVWGGGTHAVAATDLSGAVFFVTLAAQVRPASPFGTEGWIVCFSDGTNWVAYRVRTRAMYWEAARFYTFAIALGNAEPFASSGTISWSAITRVGYFWHRYGVDTVSYSFYLRNAFYIKDPVQIVGGGPNMPATFATAADALTSVGDYQFGLLQGSGQALLKSSIQIGNGGTDDTHFDAAATATEFPPVFSDSSARTVSWNALNDVVGVTIKAGAADTVRLGASSFASPTRQALTLDATTSTSASYDFAGAVFVGLAPTWKTGVPCEGITFRECGEIAFKGANVTGCSISATTSTDAACSFDANGATVSDTTIDVTGTSAAYHLELGASVTGITLADVTFTGTPGTDKVHVLATSGTVTITISGSTTLVAGDITSAGATVVIAAPQLTLTIAGSVSLAGAEIAVYDLDGTGGALGTELDHVESNVGTTRNVVLAENNLVWVQIMLAGYEEFGQQYTMPGVNSTLTAVLRPDSNA